MRVEIERLVRRWASLPLDRALVVVPDLREAAQRYADEGARLTGLAPAALPDVAPGVLPDQLTVVVFDVFAAGVDAERATAITEDMAALRRRVSGA